MNQPSTTGIPCEGWEGPCPSLNATRQNQRTCYADEAMNKVTLCPDCMRLNRQYWDEMWADYYASR